MNVRKAGIVGGAIVLIAVIGVLVVPAIIRAHSPAGVAVKWVRAGLRGDFDEEKTLQCKDEPHDSLSTLRLAFTSGSVKATDTAALDDGTWQVSVQVGSVTPELQVEVVKQHGKYVVCDQ